MNVTHENYQTKVTANRFHVLFHYYTHKMYLCMIHFMLKIYFLKRVYCLKLYANTSKA